MARAAVHALRTSYDGEGGVLVNVSSGAATLGSPGEYVQYAAAKAGVDAMTMGLAQEVAEGGMRVVGVAPGLVVTGIHEDAGEAGRRPARAADPPQASRRARGDRRRHRLAAQRRGVVRHRDDAASRRRTLSGAPLDAFHMLG